MSNIIQNVDLSHPLTDHPIWKDVRGVWLPCGNTAGGNTLYDLGPYGNHATQSTASYMPKWVATERGIGLEFDGSNDYVRVANNDSLNPTDTITLFSVYRPRTAAHIQHPIVQKAYTIYASPYYQYQLAPYYLDTDRGFSTALAINGAYVNISITDTVDVDEINHGSVTYDGSTIVLRHNEDTNSLNTSGAISTYNTPLDFARYTHKTTSDYFSNHDIFNVILFARALSASEIAFLYEQSLTGYPDLIRQTPTRTTVYIASTAYYIPSADGPRQATAEDTVGDNDGVLSFSDTVNAWQSDNPDGSYTATKADDVGSNDGTMTDFSDIDSAHVDHGINDTFGAIIPDLGSGGNDGNLRGGLADSRSPDVPANSGSEYSLNLDGVDDYVDCGDDSSLQITGNITVSAWVKCDSVSSGYHTIVGKGYVPGTGGGYWLTSNGQSVYFMLRYGDDSGYVYAAKDFLLNPGLWYHIVGTWDGTTIRLYSNGVEVANQASTLTGSIYAASDPLLIGNVSNKTYFFDGLIDDVRIYDSALTASEISDLYNGNEIAKTPVGRWKFDAKRSIPFLASSKALRMNA